MGKILMMIAVFIIAGHSIMPHHHYFEDQTTTHHIEHNHHNDSHGQAHDHQKNHEDDHQSVFSYLHLDEDFLPNQLNPIKIVHPLGELIIQDHESWVYVETRLLEVPKSYYHEFPPPKIIFSSIFSRPPPSQLNA